MPFMMYYYHPNDITLVIYIRYYDKNISLSKTTLEYAFTMYYHHPNDITHVNYIINYHINISLAATTIEYAFYDVLPSSK
jgi:hypothetical protein